MSRRLGEGRGLELGARIAAGLFQFGEDVAHRRQAEALVDEHLGVERFQRRLVAHQRADVAAAGGDDLLGDAIGFGMDGGGVERLLAVADAQKARALLERARARAGRPSAGPCGGLKAPVGVAMRDDRLREATSPGRRRARAARPRPC